MKATHAATLSLVLALVGPPLLYFGLFSMLGDPAPWVSAERIVSMRQQSEVALTFGLAAIIASLWLSGYGFIAARWRSVGSLFVCCASLVGLWLMRGQ